MLGVSPNTLRSWERRFGYPSPGRTSGGHRQYDLADVEALKQAFEETQNVSSAISIARQRGAGPPSSNRLGLALARFEEDKAARLLEESLAIRSLERTVAGGAAAGRRRAARRGSGQPRAQLRVALRDRLDLRAAPRRRTRDARRGRADLRRDRARRHRRAAGAGARAAAAPRRPAHAHADRRDRARAARPRAARAAARRARARRHARLARRDRPPRLRGALGTRRDRRARLRRRAAGHRREHRRCASATSRSPHATRCWSGSHERRPPRPPCPPTGDGEIVVARRHTAALPF